MELESIENNNLAHKVVETNCRQQLNTVMQTNYLTLLPDGRWFRSFVRNTMAIMYVQVRVQQKHKDVSKKVPRDGFNPSRKRQGRATKNGIPFTHTVTIAETIPACLIKDYEKCTFTDYNNLQHDCREWNSGRRYHEIA